ncbi:MFS transporter [Altericista sp. CCNU0014]|uniref:MFS transporter n=1 Tax=Altericista sp. CCNU0014 TaxID=3082949 RepID=UPI00384B7165
MRTFLSVWFGQFVSMLGSKLSEFALAIWAYRQIGSVTQVALLVVLMYLPTIIAAPLAGSLVDRWNRRWAMILSDSVAAGCSFTALLLSLSGNLQLWHIYLGVPILAVFSAFQAPAYSAAIAQLVPKRHQGRANGLADLPQGVAAILTPLLATWLIGIVKLNGILLIDCLTFIPALVILLSVRFPHVTHRAQLGEAQTKKFRKLLQESISSWNYIKAKASLFKLWIFIILTYFTIGMFDISFWLLVIKFGSVTKFGIVVSSAGCGMLAGSAAMSTWGGPKRRVFGILNLTILQGLVIIILGLGIKLSLAIASVGVFIYQLADPIIMGSNRAIWQSKVPMELQGRVFSLQLMFQRAALIPAFIITGVLVDRFFEPFLTNNQFIQGALGQAIGNEPGTGICLFLIALGIAKILLSAMLYRDPLLLSVEAPSLKHSLDKSPIPDRPS